MALVRQPTAITITFKDRARKATTGFFLKDSAAGAPSPIDIGNPNVAAPFAYLQELYDNMKDLSDCAGVGYSITYSWMETPVLPVPSTGNPNVERKGVMQFVTERNGLSIVTIPGIKLAAQASDGQHLDYARDGAGEAVFQGPLAADLQSMHDKLRNGATVGINTYAAANYLGDDLGVMRDAYQQTRASSGKG